VISSGPQLGYHQRIERRGSLIRALVSWPVLRILLVGLAGLAVLGHLIWWVERGSDDEHFHRSYPLGVWDGFWWAAVTATTVGYGDKSPATNRGRVVALAGMLASLFLVGAFVSQITSILEVNRFEPPFTDLDSLATTPVGVVEGSSFAAFVEAEGAIIVPFGSQAEVFAAAGSGAVDAVVANPFALADVGPRHGVTATGDVLYEEFETFGLAQGSPWREPVNQALADIQAEGEVAEIVARWNG
jgi:ABC-type amino acid transport substrate-binding protein